MIDKYRQSDFAAIRATHVDLDASHLRHTSGVKNVNSHSRGRGANPFAMALVELVFRTMHMKDGPSGASPLQTVSTSTYLMLALPAPRS